MVARSEINQTVEDRAANCLMLISRVGECGGGEGRVYRCKTCMKEFSSFQALGGHRASHRNNADVQSLSGSLTKKVKNVKTTSHPCPICGVEFPMGQALGGHMRKHRNDKTGSSGVLVTRSLLPEPATLKKSSSGKRVECLDLGLDSMDSLINLNLELGISIY